MTDVILTVIILLPLVLTYFLKSSGALVFLSVGAGYTISALAGTQLADTIDKTSFNLKNTDVNLIFLFVPALLSLFLTSHSVSLKSRVNMHTLAAAAAGLMLALVSMPFMAISAGLSTSDSKIWPLLQSGQSYIAGIGALYSLVLIWFFSKSSSKKHKS